MNPELREMLGKVAFEQSFSSEQASWESTGEQTREEYRKIAEAVAITLAEVAIPALQSLAFAFTGKEIHFHYEMKL